MFLCNAFFTLAAASRFEPPADGKGVTGNGL